MPRFTPSRRALLGGGGALAAATMLTRNAGARPAEEMIPLWPDAIPGDPGGARVPRGDANVGDDGNRTRIAEPYLLVRRAASPNGAAALVVPGGGYRFVSFDNEGTRIADWLNARGISAFVLAYRLPNEGWDDRALVPLQDAQRAMRLIRAGAGDFGIDPARVAALGFSAGGHLAGSLATRFDERVHAEIDAADRQSARPDLAGLIYPVVSMAAPFSHAGSRDNLLGAGATDALLRSASLETRVTPRTPPLFLAHAGDDPVVPVQNSVVLYEAMLAAGRPAAMHLFEEGGHGFGTRLPDTVPAAHWPELFHAYGVRKGVFTA